MEPNPHRVQEIPVEKTFSFRYQILRPHLPEAASRFEGDHDADSLHLGAFSTGETVGVISFIPRDNWNFETKPQYQLMGMAIDEPYRNLGYGKRLLQYGEEILHSKHQKLLIWLHARETAIEFYKKYNYESLGKPFDIPNICTGMLMYKTLF